MLHAAAAQGAGPVYALGNTSGAYAIPTRAPAKKRVGGPTAEGPVYALGNNSAFVLLWMFLCCCDAMVMRCLILRFAVC